MFAMRLIGSAFLAAALLSACAPPERRVADLCRAAGNASRPCVCVQRAVAQTLTPAQRRALTQAPIGPDGLPNGLSEEAAVAFAEAVSGCGARLGG